MNIKVANEEDFKSLLKAGEVCGSVTETDRWALRRPLIPVFATWDDPASERNGC